MTRFLMRRVLAVALILWLDPALWGQGQDVSRIEIESRWGGLGEPSESRLVIERKGASYFARGKQTPRGAVEGLLDAISAPSHGDSKLARLGATSDWLHENGNLALREHFPADFYAAITSRQKDLFLRSFGDPRFVEGAVGRHSTGGGTDDFPEIEVRIVRGAGEARVLRSDGNDTFLHWWIEKEGGETYFHESGAISLALWRLLPKKFTNDSRLSERALRYEIGDAVLQEVRKEWDSIEVEDRIGPYLEPLRERFTIDESRIASLVSIDIDGGESWNAKLTNATLPPNVKIGITLPIRDDKPAGVADFLGAIDDYTSLALSPGWFRAFLATHPDAEVEIRFVEKRSLSGKALERLAEDLQSNGQMGLAERISAAADKAVFIELRLNTWSRWVVLPSREMVLWEFQGDSVGNWSAKDFRFRDCYGWKCVGGLISEGGIREGTAP